MRLAFGLTGSPPPLAQPSRVINIMVVMEIIVGENPIPLES